MSLVGLGITLVFGIGACAAPRNPLSGLDEGERVISAREPQRRGSPSDPEQTPPLLINRQPVSWDEITRILGEASGPLVIEEITLNRMLRDEIDRQGITVDSDAIAREERLLSASLVRGDGLENSQVATAIMDIRNRRGLGPQRYRDLLERNAMLRALVRGQVSVDENSLRTAYDVRHGPRRIVRLLVTPTQREAASIRAALLGTSADSLRDEFMRAAIEHSTDPTAARGGLTEPISPHDPAYAPVVRQTLQSLQPGVVSAVIAVDNGFAVMLLEKEVPGDGSSFETVRADLDSLLRVRQERLLMDRLARQLLEQASITPFDESLNWAWKNRQRN